MFVRTASGASLLVSCVVGIASAQADSPRAGALEGSASNWVKLAEHAAWSPRDSSGELVFKDRMWLLGGWLNSYEDGPRDVWSSDDGIAWKLETKSAPWKHADLPTTLAFDDKMWMMAGWHGGRLPHASASNTVWYSRDGAHWTQAGSAAAWSPRLGAAGTVFKGRMWLLGGVERYYDGNERHLRNDVWSSSDGRNWTRITAEAAWAPRAYHAAVAFDGRIWVLGGGNYLPGYKAFNDVWSSEDGAHWTRVCDHATWSPRIWFSANVCRGRIWVLGGWSNHPSRNWGDVWHSDDGKTWTRLETRGGWSARHEQSVFVMRDTIWLAGGNAWPLVNDVWRLDLGSK